MMATSEQAKAQKPDGKENDGTSDGSDVTAPGKGEAKSEHCKEIKCLKAG